MGIDDYPHPDKNTGIGFCYFPDEEHYLPADLERWLPELRALGASWLVLRSVRVAPVPEAFVRGLLAAGIEPVVHLFGPRIARIELADLRRTAEQYAAWGAHYFCLYDQPNLRATWGADWGRPQLVERFVDMLLPALQIIQGAGLIPVLSPSAPGGQYWDLAFLGSLLESLKRRAPASLFTRLAVGMHNYADSRALAWGAGGPSRWTAARPYDTPAGSEDQRGFRMFEWYDAVVRARLGDGLPLISLGDGARLGLRSAPDAAVVDRAWHAKCHAGVAELFASGTLPACVFNSAFWVLATAPGDPAAPQAWYDQQARPRVTAIDALKSFARKHKPAAESPKSEVRSPKSEARTLGAALRAADPRPRTPDSGPRTSKVLRHYVLLPVFEWGPSDWHWQAAQNYVQSLRASCGFSADEARLAERVTIIGNTQGVSADVEAVLRNAGCKVARVAGDTGAETIALLNDLARAVPD